MSDDYDVDAWKRKKEPRMVCPQCDEAGHQSILFGANGTTLHVEIPPMQYYDEQGIHHSHCDGATGYLGCSRGHYCVVRYKPPNCWGCQEKNNVAWKQYEDDVPNFIVIPITDQKSIAVLERDTFYDGKKIKYVESKDVNDSR